jgi:FtsZ-binding cell division protein ZapB
MDQHRNRGPLSDRDKKYIADNYARKSPEEIAKALNRDPAGIKTYVKKMYSSVLSAPEYSNLKHSPVWKDIEKQFSPHELDMFLYHYSRIIKQFADDVFPTEELQVVDTVKLEILMNRALVAQQDAASQVADLNDQLVAAQEAKDLTNIQNLNLQINTIKATQESSARQYQDMLKQKKDLLKEMKATRQDRIKSIEGSKNSFSGWMKDIITDRDRRTAVGNYIEKMRIATDVEYQRLSELHTYCDKTVDQPILTPENYLDGQDSTDNGD